jgi:predicted transcriptional regulator
MTPTTRAHRLVRFPAAAGVHAVGREPRAAAPDARAATQSRTVLELAEWSGPAASNLLRTLRHLERHGLVKQHHKPGHPRRAPGSTGHRILDRVGLMEKENE